MAAIVNVCVDPRLDHMLIRQQVQARLQRLQLPDDRIFITNDIGGNLNGNFGGVMRLLLATQEPIVMAAVLHHDDCIAAKAGMRFAKQDCVDAIARTFKDHGIDVPILTGDIATANNTVSWDDETNPSTEVLNFRMPRMFGA